MVIEMESEASGSNGGSDDFWIALKEVYEKAPASRSRIRKFGCTQRTVHPGGLGAGPTRLDIK